MSCHHWGPHWLAWRAGLWPAGHGLHNPDLNTPYDHAVIAVLLIANYSNFFYWIINCENPVTSNYKKAFHRFEHMVLIMILSYLHQFFVVICSLPSSSVVWLQVFIAISFLWGPSLEFFLWPPILNIHHWTCTDEIIAEDIKLQVLKK